MAVLGDRHRLGASPTGIPALNLDLFTKTQVTFGETGGGIAQRVRRHARSSSASRRDGAAGRRPGRDLRERVRASTQVGARDPARARRAERRAVDRDRHLRLRAARRRVAARAAWTGAFALAIIMLPLISRSTQEVLDARAQLACARRASRSASASGGRSCGRDPADASRRDPDRRDARRRPRRRRDGAAPLHVRRSSANAVVADPSQAARLDPGDDLHLLGGARPAPERPGLGGRIRPDDLRARRQPARARRCSPAAARKLEGR